VTEKQDSDPCEIVPFVKVPTSREAEVIIRELAEGGRIVWSGHAKRRMGQRGITMPQIMNCLCKGRVTEPPVFVYTNGGGYETRIERGTAGDWLRVVVCLRLSQKLAIITVINEN